MRTSGAMEYMTPLQRATESSTTPKSVIKTMVGRGERPAPRAGAASKIRTANCLASRAHICWSSSGADGNASGRLSFLTVNESSIVNERRHSLYFKVTGRRTEVRGLTLRLRPPYNVGFALKNELCGVVPTFVGST